MLFADGMVTFVPIYNTYLCLTVLLYVVARLA